LGLAAVDLFYTPDALPVAIHKHQGPEGTDWISKKLQRTLFTICVTLSHKCILYRFYTVTIIPKFTFGDQHDVQKTGMLNKNQVCAHVFYRA